MVFCNFSWCLLRARLAVSLAASYCDDRHVRNSWGFRWVMRVLRVKRDMSCGVSSLITTNQSASHPSSNFLKGRHARLNVRSKIQLEFVHAFVTSNRTPMSTRNTRFRVCPFFFSFFFFSQSNPVKRHLGPPHLLESYQPTQSPVLHQKPRLTSAHPSNANHAVPTTNVAIIHVNPAPFSYAPLYPCEIGRPPPRCFMFTVSLPEGPSFHCLCESSQLERLHSLDIETRTSASIRSPTKPAEPLPLPFPPTYSLPLPLSPPPRCTPFSSPPPQPHRNLIRT